MTNDLNDKIIKNVICDLKNYSENIGEFCRYSKSEDLPLEDHNILIDIINLIDKYRDYVVPEDIFDLWKRRKVGLGWAYGVEYDLKKRLCPYLVEYDQLRGAEKVKIKILLNTIKTIIRSRIL
jgi:hypothetical protein